MSSEITGSTNGSENWLKLLTSVRTELACRFHRQSQWKGSFLRPAVLRHRGHSIPLLAPKAVTWLSTRRLGALQQAVLRRPLKTRNSRPALPAPGALPARPPAEPPNWSHELCGRTGVPTLPREPRLNTGRSIQGNLWPADPATSPACGGAVAGGHEAGPGRTLSTRLTAAEAELTPLRAQGRGVDPPAWFSSGSVSLQF